MASPRSVLKKLRFIFDNDSKTNSNCKKLRLEAYTACRAVGRVRRDTRKPLPSCQFFQSDGGKLLKFVIERADDGVFKKIYSFL